MEYPEEVDRDCPICKRETTHRFTAMAGVGHRPEMPRYRDPTYRCEGCGVIRGGLIEGVKPDPQGWRVQGHP